MPNVPAHEALEVALSFQLQTLYDASWILYVNDVAETALQCV